ncbi:MAG: hypothetical protein KJ824_17095, partial [Alphaproteobacteria bacterium]|nr:hypothetical protein [Alphaproteobacteria bacterium]
MSSETPQDPGKSGAAQPFARGRIQWGRPPQPIFQVGPLPRAAGGVANIASPPGRTGAGILRGSMVPPAAPVEPPPPPEAEVAPEPVADTVASPEPKPEPEPEPVTAPAEIVAEVEEAEPAVTVPPPLSGEAAPVAEPRRLPSVVVTPAIYAGVSAAIQKVTGKDRWVIVAAVVAVLVTGGFIWLATLPAGGAGGVDQTAPTPVATPTLDPAPLPVEAEVATVARPAAPTAQPPETRPPEPRP